MVLMGNLVNLDKLKNTEDTTTTVIAVATELDNQSIHMLAIVEHIMQYLKP
jgi:hypothetical protein